MASAGSTLNGIEIEVSPPPAYEWASTASMPASPAPSTASTSTTLSRLTESNPPGAPNALQLAQLGGLASPLGPVHNADPGALGEPARTLCSIFLPRAWLARRLRRSGSSSSSRRSQEMTDELPLPDSVQEKLRLKAEAERIRKAGEMIERDRILDHNLRMMGM